MIRRSLFILIGLIAAFIPAAVPTAAGRAALERYEYTEYHMGVDVRMVVYAASKRQAEAAVAAAFERFARLDDIMSDYRADSELMRLCAKAGGPPVAVSPELYRVLERSQLLAKQTNGGFDVTCSPVVRLWRTARQTHVLPTKQQLADAVARVGWQKMKMNPELETVELTQPGMQLDLGAIGKGYADDLALQTLRNHGIKSALIEAGGDLVVSDPPPGEPGWKLKTEVKADNLPGATAADATMMVVHNCAVSTSGDTEQYVEIGGVRYSHVVDPRTGEALTNRLAVLVIAKDGLTSDGLSTAVSVVGSEAGVKLTALYRGAKVWIGHD